MIQVMCVATAIHKLRVLCWLLSGDLCIEVQFSNQIYLGVHDIGVSLTFIFGYLVNYIEFSLICLISGMLAIILNRKWHGVNSKMLSVIST